MAPSYSKIPIPAVPTIAVRSGLRCSHESCYALFTTLDDIAVHASTMHEGKIEVVTCSIHECTFESGETRLYRVLDEADMLEEAGNEKQPGKQEQLQTTFIPASSHLKASRDWSSPSPPKLTHSPSTNIVSEKTPPSTQPSLSSVVTTPPCSQPRVSYHDAKLLSRQSTEDIASFSSSSSSSSSSSALSLFSSSSSSLPLPSSSTSSVPEHDIRNEDKEALDRIHNAMLEMIDECRVCWANREVKRPHHTYRCPTKMLSERGWEVFKADLRFPPGALCYFCLIPYGPPFLHARAPLGSQATPELCDFPDALKELAYVLYSDESLRGKVFAKLGVAEPSSLYLYKRYITRSSKKGLLGVYQVIDAYLRVREEEGSLGAE